MKSWGVASWCALRIGTLVLTENRNTGNVSSIYKTLDDASLNRKHWTTVITAGMGFFTDAYDLFIIGTVTAILTPLWHLSTGQLSLLNSISLLSSVFGAIIFGKLMDRLGRKAMYGIEVILLVLGAIASAFSQTFTELLIFRVVVGIGVGGDYATSAVITSEYANKRDRGRLIGTVFAMQGFGLLAGPLFASILLATGVSHDIAWRVMLGFGAVPAASVIYLRRKIKETPRFTMNVKGDVASTVEAIRWTTGQTVQLPTGPATASRHGKGPRLSDPLYRKRLLGTAGTWLLMDIAFYGNGVSSQVILKALFGAKASLLHNTVVAALIFLVFAVPGYWLAVYLMDKIGRKRIQWQGFLVMALGYGLIMLVPGIVKIPVLFLVIYGITYFFIEFGPNETTFVYPSEIFPTSIRGTADGLSAAGGKIGAFVAALLMPTIVKDFGLPDAMGILAVVSLAGVLLTLWSLPEPMGKTLEDASGEIDQVDRQPQEHAS
ncbi:MAG: MFS transporter [Acidimicrobiaceae bacterium]|nr:MFS transporter [Acidimicrobiaceae bacterium]